MAAAMAMAMARSLDDFYSYSQVMGGGRGSSMHPAAELAPDELIFVHLSVAVAVAVAVSMWSSFSDDDDVDGNGSGNGNGNGKEP